MVKPLLFVRTFTVFIAWCALSSSVSAQPETLIVVSQPLAGLGASGSSTTQVLTRDALADLPYDRLDAALASQSSFGLFRRIPSVAANPTIQGATLRGIGPNGAGRASVLLDGAPLNDPFGNWVNWSALPLNTISQVTLARGGRPLDGGPGALSGLIAIETGSLREGQTLSLSGTTLEGFDAAVSHAGTIGRADVIASVSGGQREGYILLPQSQRGAADVPTASHNLAGTLKIGLPVSETWRAALQVRAFSEGRDNGLEGARNATDGFDGSLRFTRGGSADPWAADILFYGQVRAFENLFTATDEARETTRQVLDQFSVPAYGAGVRGQLVRRWGEGSSTTLFTQLDQKSGETRENFRNLGAGFTRERRAGGQQLLYGAGVLHVFGPASTITAEIGARLDGNRISNGSRVETDTTASTVLRDDSFAAQTDLLPSGEIGITWAPAAAWALSARGYASNRLPSLNEFFRPFRVGNDITEANPFLKTETLYGIDIGARFEPISGQFIQLTVFRNWVLDAVGNLTVAGEDGGVIDPCGFVPTGGSCRQRGNIDRIGVLGAEMQLGARLGKTLRITGFYAYSDAQVKADSAAPALIGKRLAQVPRHQASTTLFWQPTSLALETSLTLRGQSAQFDDDLNLRRLDGFAAVDAAIRWAVREDVSIRLDVVNLSNSEIQAGLSGDGLITRGQPVTATLGVDVQF